MIFVTGFVGNVNHMTLGANTTSWWGVVLYLAWMAVVVGFWLVASPLTIKHPRRIQKAGQAMVGRLKGLLERTNPTATYSESDISPYFWTNGEKPESDEYQRLKAGNWSEYRLHIDGLVGSPRELSYADLLALPRQDQITQHFCIQGWSGIAKWSGVPMRVICEFVDAARADTTRIRSSTATACRFKGASIS